MAAITSHAVPSAAARHITYLAPHSAPTPHLTLQIHTSRTVLVIIIKTKRHNKTIKLNKVFANIVSAPKMET